MAFSDLQKWAKKTGQEMLKGQFVGEQEDPKFKGPLITNITDPYQLEKLIGFTLLDESKLRNRGLDLNSLFGIILPEKDFYGNNVPLGDGFEPGIFEMK
jgi:hypothetical protein